MKKNKIILPLVLTVFTSPVIANTIVEKQNITIEEIVTPSQEIIDISDTEFISSNRNVKNRIKSFNNRNKVSYSDLGNDYTQFKNMLQKDFGLSYSLDISLMPQRGNPNGKQTAWQTVYSGAMNWDAFKSDFGNGSFAVSYLASRYWGTSIQNIDEKIGVGMPVNDFPTYSNSFANLTYTHQFIGSLKWLAVTVGQFPIYDFDGTAYNSNQQINFINYGFSQNGSSVYPVSSLGAYVNITPVKDVVLTAGIQDAHNISGTQIEYKSFDDKEYTAFTNLAYNPTINGLQGQYSVLMYFQPSVPELDYNTVGWSLNMMQHYTQKMAIMARVNGINSDAGLIKQSYMLGNVFNNPFGRNKLDQFGIAYGLNKINEEEKVREYENVIETFYSFGLGNFFTITPDVQLYINPAYDKSKTAMAFALRLTAQF